MTELSKMLEEYRAGERELPTYDELAALLTPTLDQVIDSMYTEVAALYQVPERLLRGTPIFQSAEQNEQLARDAQAILDAEMLGVGFLVDGVSVHPSRVTVLRPTAAKAASKAN